MHGLMREGWREPALYSTRTPCYPGKLQVSGVRYSDQSGAAHRKTVSACQTIGKVLESHQDEVDGPDAAELDAHCPGSDCRKCEPQPARLDELLPLSELKPGDGKGQGSCRTTTAQAPDATPQGEGQKDR